MRCSTPIRPSWSSRSTHPSTALSRCRALRRGPRAGAAPLRPARRQGRQRRPHPGHAGHALHAGGFRGRRRPRPIRAESRRPRRPHRLAGDPQPHPPEHHPDRPCRRPRDAYPRGGFPPAPGRPGPPGRATAVAGRPRTPTWSLPAACRRRCGRMPSPASSASARTAAPAWPSTPAAPAWRRSARFAASGSLSPTARSLAELTHKESQDPLPQPRATMPFDLRAAALPLLDRIDHVAVTLGADGACLFAREGSWRARLQTTDRQGRQDRRLRRRLPCRLPPPPRRRRPPADCLRHAVACGTASTHQVRAGEVDRPTKGRA